MLSATLEPLRRNTPDRSFTVHVRPSHSANRPDTLRGEHRHLHHATYHVSVHLESQAAQPDFASAQEAVTVAFLEVQDARGWIRLYALIIKEKVENQVGTGYHAVRCAWRGGETGVE